MTWFNFQHLHQTTAHAGRPKTNMIYNYFWHFALSMTEAGKLFFWSLCSVVHAIFPWVLHFKLLQWRVNAIESLKNKLPNDPILNKINFDK